MARVKARADTVSANARAGVEAGLRGMKGCTVMVGHARFVGRDTVSVDEEQLTAPRIFINVGGRAVVPDFPGIDRISYLTNTSMLELDRVPAHLVIIGGSYIGLEFAQMYRRFGAAVTVVEMKPRLVAVDPRNSRGRRDRRTYRRRMHPLRASPGGGRCRCRVHVG
jgi:pyruvate/2-oxoglutarate dehydrogenase complex dihydrolipoamide dehydrogenase (E3) component